MEYVNGQRVELTCPGFEGEAATILGPYNAPGAEPGEYVIERANGTNLAVRTRDMRPMEG